MVSPSGVPRWSAAPGETPTLSLFPRHWIDSVAKSVETKENPYGDEIIIVNSFSHLGFKRRATRIYVIMKFSYE